MENSENHWDNPVWGLYIYLDIPTMGYKNLDKPWINPTIIQIYSWSAIKLMKSPFSIANYKSSFLVGTQL